MKNNKTLRQILTGVGIGALIGLVVMTIALIDIPTILQYSHGSETAIVLPTWSLWMVSEEAMGSTDLTASVLSMNWKIAGAYLALIVIALASFAVKLGTCSVPAMKETKSCTALVLDIFAIVCIILALVALFMPLTLTLGEFAKVEDEDYTGVAKMTTATQALAYCGAPIALGLGLVNGGVALKAAK